MGEVWLAEDTVLSRKVAVKLLPPAFVAQPRRVRRFAQEARAASALNHPNIITIYEIGEVHTEAGPIHYPEDTPINLMWLPMIRGALALRSGDALRTIDELQTTVAYEAAGEFWPQYLRGLAYRKLERGQ